MPPDIHDIERDLWLAFWDLSSERQAGMSVGPIPWSAMVAYHAHSPWIEFGAFMQIMRRMDQAYMEHAQRED